MKKVSRAVVVCCAAICLFPALLFSFPIPDTGQVKCYGNSAEITCPEPGQAFYGQDGQYLINPRSYTKLDAQGNALDDTASSWEMVRDNFTGLIWEVKTNDGSENDKDNQYTWYDGSAGTAGDGTDTKDFIDFLNAMSFGDRNDWRLPTITELRTLIDRNEGMPTIDTDYFPNTQKDTIVEPLKIPAYYSATQSSAGSNSVWRVLFNAGWVNSNSSSYALFARAVSGAIIGDSHQYFIDGTGTVTDSTTGLMWLQKTDDGGAHDKDNTYSWQAALNWVQNLNQTNYMGYSDWRLPSVSELESIVDIGSQSPSVNDSAFPFNGTGIYWTSTTYVLGFDYAYFVEFDQGTTNFQSKTNAYFVRAVRGGQQKIEGNLYITNPAMAAVFEMGSILPITWNPAYFEEDVTIALSRDGGATYSQLVASTPNDGAYDWLVTGPVSVNCMLKITPLTDETGETTQGLFSISDISGDGLVAYYPFAGNADDVSGNGNDATAYGARLSTDRFGNPHSSYYFDGSGQYIQTPVDSNQKPVSFAGWFLLEDTAADYSIFDSSVDGGFGHTLYYQGGHLTVQYHNGEINTGIRPEAGRWYHAAVSFGDEIDVYIDGERVSTAPYTGTVYDGSDFRFGKHTSPYPKYLKGKIDDVRIYDRPLSGIDVGRLYAHGRIVTRMAYSEAYDLDNNRVPEGWAQSLNNGGPGIQNGKLVAAPTDGNSVVKKTVDLAGRIDEVRLTYTGNTFYSYWNMRNGIRLEFSDGAFVRIYNQVEDVGSFFSSTTNSGVFVNVNGTRTNYPIEQPYGTYQYLVIVENGAISMRVAGDTQAIVRHESPVINLNTITSIGFEVGTTTEANAWIDNLGVEYYRGDTDGDGMPFWWEEQYFGDQLRDGTEDADSDGLADLQEFQLGTHPYLSDTDNDGLPDGFESKVNSSDPNMATGLVAHYPFNGDANDAGPNVLNGTVAGPVLSSDRFGNADRAYYFDGATDKYIEVADNDLLDLTGDFTISSWVKIIDTGGMIASKHRSDSNTEGTWAIKVLSTLLDFQNMDDGVGDSHSITYIDVPENEWHLVTYTYDEANTLLNVYFNGALVDSFTKAIVINNTSRNLYIGSDENNGYSNWFRGWADEFRIYSRALSESEVREIYRAGNESFQPTQSIPTHDAYGMTSFIIDGATYLAVANAYDGASTNIDSWIYRWNGTAFEEFQAIGTYGGHHFRHFRIDGEHYLSVANSRSGSAFDINSKVYKWNGTDFQEIDSILTYNARAWDNFEMDGDTFLVVANAMNNSTETVESVVYKWNGAAFAPFQSIETTYARDVETFTAGGDPHIAFANGNGVGVKIYQWAGDEFFYDHTLPAGQAADIESFAIDGVTYLAIADFNNGGFATESKIYRYDIGQYRFVEIQGISTIGAWDMSHFMINGRHYLGVANQTDGAQYNLNSQIYRWNGTSFELYQSFPTKGVTTIEPIFIDGNAYFGVANAQEGSTYNVDSVIYEWMGNADGDGDGMADAWEMWRFGDLSHDGGQDGDNDGLTDLEEYQYRTEPLAADGDKDGLSDGFEVKANGSDPNVAGGLVAYYPFNGNARDESGNDSDATVIGSTLTSDRYGNSEKAYAFDGVDDTILLNANNTLMNVGATSDFTIAYWFHSSQFKTGMQVLLHSMTAVNGDFVVGASIDDQDLSLYVADLGNGTNGVVVNLEENGWVHVGMVVSDGRLKTYIGGRHIMTVPIAGVAAGISNYSGLRLGTYVDDAYPFEGKIDDVRMYNRALSDAEIREVALEPQIDTDGDGLPDSWEITSFLDLSHDGTGDDDGDGLTDLQEYQLNTQPTVADSDSDGMPDGWEAANGLSPNFHDAFLDADSDKFTNGREYQDGTDPQEPLSHFELPAITGRVPGTGQTTCSNDAIDNAVITCPDPGGAFYGQDGNYTINPRLFLKMDTLGNYLPDSASSWSMVYDAITGLTWEIKIASNGSPNLADPHDADNLYTWYDSNPATNGGYAGTAGVDTDTEDFIQRLNEDSFGGNSDWRMPTAKELASILYFENNSPAVDTNYFPNHRTGYWTSTTLASDSAKAIQVYSIHGNFNQSSKSSTNYVRAVRGTSPAVDSRWVNNGDGSVTDRQTGLMWETKSLSPTSTHYSGRMGDWESALAWVKALNTDSYLGYNDWRLPTISELLSIIDHSETNPAIDSSVFIYTMSGYYYSSTVSDDAPGTAWVTDSWGGIQIYPKTDTYYYRAVRGGQNVVSGNILITSPLQASAWSINDTMPIRWDTHSIAGDVSIAISYDGGGTYTEIVAATPNDGSHDWVVTGSVSPNCYLKITPGSDITKASIQGFFTIKPYLNGGLVAFYPFNGNAQDETMNGHGGTVDGATLAADRYEDSNSAYSFNNALIQSPSNIGVTVDPTDKLTLTAWIYPSTVNIKQSIISGWGNIDGLAGLFDFWIGTDNSLYFKPERNQNNGITWKTSPGLIDAGQWYQVAVVWNELPIGSALAAENAVSFFVNGQKFSPAVDAYASPADWMDIIQIHIGKTQGSANPFDGRIDEVRLYNRALSDTEIQSLYDFEKVPNQAPITPATPGPADATTDVSVDIGLVWTGGDPDVDDTVTYDLYLGTGSQPKRYATNLTSTSFTPPRLAPQTTYYWQVVSKDDNGGETTGPVWQFTTGAQSGSLLFIYSGDVLPDADGWTHDGNTSAIASVTSGALNFPYDIAAASWYSRPWTQAPGYTNVAEFDIKVDSGTEKGVSLTLSYGAHYRVFYLSPTGVQGEGGAAYAFDTTDGYHTYKAFISNGVFKLYIDNDLALNENATSGSWPNGFYGVTFGDGSSAQGADMYFDEVRVYREFNDADTDIDGMADGFEEIYFGDLSHDGSGDGDSDGLTDVQEYQNDTNPTISDSDADGMPDGWEVSGGLDPNTDDALIDSDGDRFVNVREYQDNTHPQDADSHLVIPPITGRVPDTGQTTSYTDTFGEDSDYLINPPSYLKMDSAGLYLPDSASSWVMVKDTVTGLIWEVKTNDGSVHDKDNRYTWYNSDPDTNGGNAGTPGDGTDTEDFINALNEANFGGYSDWRLPMLNELQSIVDYSRSHPTIDTTYFPNTMADDYWSDSRVVFNDCIAWRLRFNVGSSSSTDDLQYPYLARAVRGQRLEPAGQLSDNGDGTVTDSGSGLMWAQKSDDEGINDKDNTYTWTEALVWVTALNTMNYLGYSDWRLPDIKELESLGDLSVYNPAIDTSHFPKIQFSTDIQSSVYWSSTTNPDNANGGYGFNTLWGVPQLSQTKETKANYGLAVRGGQRELVGHLNVSSPAQASRFFIDDLMPIRWDTQRISGDVTIVISRDGGKSYEAISMGTPNDGAFEWVIDGETSVNCMLKIAPVGDEAKGTVQGLFSILPRYEKGIVAHYPFSGNANDISGDGYDGVVNGPTPTQDRFGSADGAYSFDGDNDYITVPEGNPVAGIGTGGFTVSFWTALKSLDSYRVLLQMGENLVGSYDEEIIAVGYDISGGIYYALNDYKSSSNTDTVTILAPGAVELDKWYQITLVVSGQNVIAYLDGQQVASNADAYNFTESVFDLLNIGSEDYGGTKRYYANARIDDVRIYNEALSATEVTELYDAEKVVNSPPAAPQSPTPSDTNTGVALDAALAWVGGDPDDGDTVTYDVYLGTESGSLSAVSNDQASTTYIPAGLTPNTLYYWQIVATDDSGSTTTGPEWSFTTLNRAPDTPGSPTPANSATNVLSDATLIWTGTDPDAGDALTYDIYVDTSGVFAAATATSLSSSQYSVPTEWAPHTTYYWKVVARDSHGGSAESPVWQFTTLNSAPNAPNTPSPDNAGTGIVLDEDLTWACSDPDGDTTSYDVHWGTVSGALSVVSSDQTGATYDPGALLANTTYYWQVVAEDGFGGITAGPEWSFTTLNRTPYAPSSPAPVDNAPAVLLSQALTWSGGDPDLGDAVTYDVLLGTVSGALTVVSSGQSGAVYTPAALNHGTTYYWQVVAKDSHSGQTTGPEWSFTTENYSSAALSDLPANPTDETSASITVGGTDIVSYMYRVDSGAWSSETPVAQTIDLVVGTGSHIIEVRGKNSSGIWQPEADASTYNWAVDAELPSVTVFTVSDASTGSAAITNDRTIAVSMTAADNDAIARYLITENSATPTAEVMNAGAGNAPTGYTIQSAGDGDKTLYAWVMDGVGNIGTSAAATITLDTVTSVTISGGDRCTGALAATIGGTREAEAAVTIESIDAVTIGAVAYPTTTTWTVDLSDLKPGSNTVTAVAADAAGNLASDDIGIRQSTPTNIDFDAGGVTELVADGSEILSISAMVTDGLGTPQPVCDGTSIEVSTTLGGLAPTTVATTNGVISFDLTAPTVLGTATLTATHSGGAALTGSIGVNMIPGPMARLVFTDETGTPVASPLTLALDVQSPLLKVQIQDAFGHPVTADKDYDVFFSSTAGTGGQYSTNAIDWASQLPTKITAGSNSAFFWFRFTTPQGGDINLSAREYGVPLTQAVMVVQEKDSAPPTTTAIPAGGHYDTSQSVSLSCDDGSGSGCQEVYYSTDGAVPTTPYAGAIVIDTDTTLKFYSTDIAGNGEAVKTETYTIDTQAPTVTITNPGDVQAVPADTLNSLECTVTELGGELDTVNWQIKWVSGSTTYYLDTDKVTPTTTASDIPATFMGGSLWSLNIGSWVVGRQYTVTATATDLAGNSATDDQTFIYGVVPTEISVQIVPDTVGLAESFTISGQINDATNGNPVDLSAGVGVYLGLTPNGDATQETPINVTTNRSGYFEVLVDCSRGVTTAGNWIVEAIWGGVENEYLDSASSPTPFTVSKGATRLKLDLDEAHTLKADSTPQITGSIALENDCTGADLSGLGITVTFTPPAGSALSPVARVVQTGIDGSYLVDDVTFNAVGEWVVSAHFDGSSNYLASNPAAVSVNATAAAGYGIIVQGKLNADGEGIADHNHTTNFVFNTLVKRGLDPDLDIEYFNYDTTQPNVIVDAVPTKTGIAAAITTWARDRIVATRGDLYIVMVDHGWTAAANEDVGEFYIYPDSPITSTEMAGWLNALQSELASVGITDRRIVIVLGFCRSGAFVDELAGPNRIIISSATAGEYSHRGGPRGNDYLGRPIVEGEFFVSEFFKQVALNKSVKDAFIAAKNQTRDYTKEDEAEALNAPHFDASAQHALLEDSGDGVGSHDVDSDNSDGETSGAAYIGIAPDSGYNDPGISIQRISGDQFLETYQTTVPLMWAKTNPVDSIWVEVKKPGYDPADPGKGAQLSVDTFVKTPTAYNSTEGRYEWDQLGADPAYPQGFFDVAGTYQVFFIAKSATGETSPLRSSRVYKAKVGNQWPVQTGFTQTSPANGATTLTDLVLDWTDVFDPDEDTLTYSVILSHNDPGFSNPMLFEGLRNSSVLLTQENGILNKTTYYWKVRAVDAFGAAVETGVWSFTTDNTNAPFPCFLKGYVYNNNTGRVIKGASVTLNGATLLPTDTSGNFLAELATGTYQMSVSATGFEDRDVADVDLTAAGGIVTQNVGLTPLVTGRPGDATGEGDVTLDDAVAILKAMSSGGDITQGADITGDGRVDVRDVLFLLQLLSELRN